MKNLINQKNKIMENMSKKCYNVDCINKTDNETFFFCKNCFVEISKFYKNGDSTSDFEKILLLGLLKSPLTAKSVKNHFKIPFITTSGEKKEKTIDIGFPREKFLIEVDGKQHRELKQLKTDLYRDHYSDLDGYFTLRIPVEVFDTKENFKEVLNTIISIYKQRKAKWWQFWK